MAKVEHQELEADVLRVLRAAAGEANQSGFLTAYQILNRLPEALQAQLRQAYGPASGKGTGQNYSPASRIAKVAATSGDVETRYLDTRGLQFQVPNDQLPSADVPNDDVQDVTAGRASCGIFRARP